MLQQVALVAATEVRAQDAGACVLAEPVLVRPTLIHLLHVLHHIVTISSGAGLLWEPAV